MSLTDLYRETMDHADARERDEFLDHFREDVTWKVPGAELRGREEVWAWVEPFWGAFSSFRHELHRVVEADGTVVGEGTFVGLNDGPLVTPGGTMPPTGREIRFDFAMIATGDAAEGKAASVHIYFDQLEFLGQLGVVPVPEPAAAAS
jgi:ketosteroid isomerase-like protein